MESGGAYAEVEDMVPVPCLVCGKEPSPLLVPEFEAVRRGGVGALGELAGAGGTLWGTLSWRIEEMEAVS